MNFVQISIYQIRRKKYVSARMWLCLWDLAILLIIINICQLKCILWNAKMERINSWHLNEAYVDGWWLMPNRRERVGHRDGALGVFEYGYSRHNGNWKLCQRFSSRSLLIFLACQNEMRLKNQQNNEQMWWQTVFWNYYKETNGLACKYTDQFKRLFLRPRFSL